MLLLLITHPAILFYLRAGCVSIPEFPFQENQTAFTLCTLLRQPEVYAVLCEIWVECNKVSDMKLFNVTLLKPMRLEEFKNTQSQMQLQVRRQIPSFCRTYLKNVMLSGNRTV